MFTPPLRPVEPRNAETERNTLGYSVIDFAEQILGISLYPWQKVLLLRGLELKEDGGFRFRTLIILVARQNGKSTLGQVLALWALYVLQVPLIIGTAQDLSTAEDLWEDVVDLADNNVELEPLIKAINRRNGAKSLEIKLGTEYKVKASTRKAARGLSADLLLLDELREHTNWEAWGAVSKDLANDTPILTGDGNWSTIGKCKVGDTVFSPDGRSVTVTEVTPIREKRPMYRVTSTDGRSLVASESHLWNVVDTRRTYDLTRWETLTTAQLLERGLFRQGTQYAYRLPLQEGLKGLPEREMPVDPYVLGCWLGDGVSREGVITVGAQDLDETCLRLDEAGATVVGRVERRRGTWMLRVHVRNRPLRAILREMGLLQNKHVPEEYLTASWDQRLALLQGLMDTDGCATRPGYVKFTNTNESLVDAVLFLARSLGFTAFKREFVPKLRGKECSAAWEVYFRTRSGDPVVFRLDRKAVNCGVGPSRGRLLSSIASIEPVESVPSTCIGVDSADHLFLAGRDLMPTHNTMMARPQAQAWALSNAGDELSVVLMSLRKKAHLALGDPDGINATDVPSVTDGVAEQPVNDTSVGIFEWSAAPGRAIWDREGWAEANPAMGYGALTEEALASAAATDPEPVFRTECLCQWILGTLEGPFPQGSWEKCADLAGEIAADSELSYCVDVSVDRSTAWVAVVGSQESGRPQGEIATGRPGGGWLEWVPEWFERIAAPDDPVRVVVASRGMNPSSALVEPLRGIPGIQVVEWAGPDVPMGCGLLYDRVVASLEEKPPFPVFAHRGQEALNLAAATAAQRVSGDGWYWDRRNSAQDASPLVAVTGALWDHLRIREEAPAPSIYSHGPLALI